MARALEYARPDLNRRERYMCDVENLEGEGSEAISLMWKKQMR